MPKIFTLTCNLLAQHTLDFKEIRFGEVNRAQTSEFCVGGKGVNVAAALLKFGLDATAVIFSGGRTGERCGDFLSEKGIKFLPVKTAFETRSGFVCRDENSETSFFTKDALLTDADFGIAMSEISKYAESGDILALCGSVPNWTNAKFSALKALVEKAEMRFVCDTYGEPLKDLFFEKSEILKVNADEIRAFSASSFCELNAKTKAAFFGVTNGAETAYAGIGAKTEAFIPRKIRGRVFATGCGDLVLACLIKALAEKGECGFSDFRSAMDFASECASQKGIFGF